MAKVFAENSLLPFVFNFYSNCYSIIESNSKVTGAFDLLNEVQCSDASWIQGSRIMMPVFMNQVANNILVVQFGRSCAHVCRSRQVLFDQVTVQRRLLSDIECCNMQQKRLLGKGKIRSLQVNVNLRHLYKLTSFYSIWKDTVVIAMVATYHCDFCIAKKDINRHTPTWVISKVSALVARTASSPFSTIEKHER